MNLKRIVLDKILCVAEKSDVLIKNLLCHPSYK